MRQIYREKWTAKLSTTEEYQAAKADYGYFLAKMSSEQIAAGLEACETRFEWPPVPGDFYKAGREGVISHPSHEDRIALPKPEVDREKVTACIAEMKTKIRGPRSNEHRQNNKPEI
jgi:hypothetical protein